MGLQASGLSDFSFVPKRAVHRNRLARMAWLAHRLKVRPLVRSAFTQRNDMIDFGRRRSALTEWVFLQKRGPYRAPFSTITSFGGTRPRCARRTERLAESIRTEGRRSLGHRKPLAFRQMTVFINASEGRASRRRRMSSSSTGSCQSPFIASSISASPSVAGPVRVRWRYRAAR